MFFLVLLVICLIVLYFAGKAFIYLLPVILVVAVVTWFYEKTIFPHTADGKHEISRVRQLDKVGIPAAQAKLAAEVEINHAICIKQRKVDDLRDIPKACNKRDEILKELAEVGVCNSDGKWHLCEQTSEGADNKSRLQLGRVEVTPEIRARYEIGRAMEVEDMECQAGKAGYLQACARRDALQKQLDATYKKQFNFVENPTTKQYSIANSNCRGETGPMYEEECAKRDALYKELETQGLCYERLQEGNVISEGWIKC